MVLRTARQFSLLLFFLIILASNICSAQLRNISFVPVAPDALSSSFVRCIYKDSRGFMWFGTGTGLIRYDGTNVYRYEHVLGKRNTISDNRINAIIEDSKNNLWIGTAQGLVVYSRELDHFTDVDSLPGNKNTLNSRYVSALCGDQKGRIWIGTLGQGVTVYDQNTGIFSNFLESTLQGKIPPANYVTSLFHFRDTVWAGTKGGLKVFDARTMSRTSLKTDENLQSKEITQVKRDASGNMWLTTVDREIIKLTPEKDSFKVLRMPLSKHKLAGTVGSLLTLSMDTEGNVWAAGENSGLNFLDAKTGQLMRYDADENIPAKLPTNSIRSVYVDDTGVTWIGTYNRGAFMIDNRAKQFEIIQGGRSARTPASGISVKSIVQDDDSNIWLACDASGLAMLDTVNHELVYPPDLNAKFDTPHLSALLLDDAGILWVGSWGRGVYRVNLKSREVKNFRLESNGFGDNKVFTLFKDNQNRIWVGSVGSGLFYLNPTSEKFIGLNEEVKSDYVRKTAYVSSIIEDGDGSIWAGTLFGLYRLNPRDRDIYDVQLYMRDNQPGSIGSYEIQTMHLDNNGDLWVGTGDNGVAILPYGKGHFQSIQKEDGLPSNSVRGILKETNGKVWVSTNRGLSLYDPVHRTFKNYTKSDGLPSNEFNINSRLLARDGKFYFGTDKGLVAFYPDSIRVNPIKPTVFLTDLKLNNQSVQIAEKGSPLTKHIGLTSAIELPHNQRSFAIDFVALNYGQSSKCKYCYKLDGFDKSWNCVGSETRATYTNLDPGKYVFLVKAFSSDGIESESPARLTITIQQAPWKTRWAMSLYVVILGSFALFLVRLRIERIKIKNQLEFERLAREQEHLLSESKNQFFTNISHEFRTPLSLIAMPLEALLSDPHLPSPVKDRLETMRLNTNKMLRLVNELMDLTKMDNGKLTLSVREGDPIGFVMRVARTFEDMAGKRDIHFGLHAMVKSSDGWFDHDKLEKIIMNVVSNAFKFTPDGGTINLVMNTKEIETDNGNKQRWFELSVIDNGVGIAPEELPFIFDKFYQAASAETVPNPGTGIGLALTKALTELHHGSIVAESTSESTIFLIQIPIDRLAYADHEIHESAKNIREDGKAAFALEPAPEVYGDQEEDRDRARILVVEDNEELRTYIVQELRREFSILEAKNGLEGLDIAMEKIPDLIISDILMPEKNGIEFCREIKSNLKTSHIPVILLTAKTTVEDQIAGVSNGADVYITKPFSIRFLTAQVSQIIETRQLIFSRFSQDVHLMPAKVASNELDQEFLQKAIDYIIANLQDPQLGVDSLASLFNLGRKQVYRKIKALTGKSAVDFIRMVRLKEALRLMDSHKYTLSEIAYQTGFNSASYFTRCFKDQFGKAPSEFMEASAVQR